MKLWLLGTRGSTPAPGPDFVRFGGHTSCVAVVPDGADEATLVMDAGTGIRMLTDRLASPAFHGSILLSHLHWDHIEGLPFCRALDQDDTRVDIYAPDQLGLSGHELLARTMSPPSFPIFPDGMHGTWNFLTIGAGQQQVETFRVTVADIAHKGGRTLGYRVEDDSGSFAYLPDHCPSQGVTDEAIELIRGVDVLLHDAQFLENERAIAEDYGHATIDEAVNLATTAEVGRLVLFHHSPVRTDAALDKIEAGCMVDPASGQGVRPRTIVARDCMVIDIPG